MCCTHGSVNTNTHDTHPHTYTDTHRQRQRDRERQRESEWSKERSDRAFKHRFCQRLASRMSVCLSQSINWTLSILVAGRQPCKHRPRRRRMIYQSPLAGRSYGFWPLHQERSFPRPPICIPRCTDGVRFYDYCQWRTIHGTWPVQRMILAKLFVMTANCWRLHMISAT